MEKQYGTCSRIGGITRRGLAIGIFERTMTLHTNQVGLHNSCSSTIFERVISSFHRICRIGWNHQAVHFSTSDPLRLLWWSVASGKFRHFPIICQIRNSTRSSIFSWCFFFRKTAAPSHGKHWKSAVKIVELISIYEKWCFSLVGIVLLHPPRRILKVREVHWGRELIRRYLWRDFMGKSSKNGDEEWWLGPINMGKLIENHL